MDKNSINCRLCIKNESNLINVFDEQNLHKNIPAVLTQHFWFQVQEDDINYVICEICWLQVINFHSFYIQVKQNHENLKFKDDTIKVDDSEPPKLVISEIKIPKQINLNEENYCVDQQINDDYLSEDDTCKKAVFKKTKQCKSRKELDPIDQQKVEQENQKIEEYFPMECELCTTRCSNFQNIQFHYRQEHKMRGYLRCCKRKFLERSSLLEHIQWHLNPETFKCDICNKTLADKRGLSDHQARHLSTEEKPFKCTECPKTYTKRFILEDHLAKHKSTKKFDCNSCDKSFSTIPLLRAHKNNIHTRANIFICDICAKEFRGKCLLERHQKAVHQNIVESKVQCQLCRKWLKHKYQLKQHLVRHEESKMNLSCSICGKRSLNHKALRSHIKIVHNDINHKCTICEKTFKQQITLKEHMAAHTGDTLYSCPYCTKTFNSSANMYSHKKKIHVKEWQEHERLKTAGVL